MPPTTSAPNLRSPSSGRRPTDRPTESRSRTIVPTSVRSPPTLAPHFSFAPPTSPLPTSPTLLTTTTSKLRVKSPMPLGLRLPQQQAAAAAVAAAAARPKESEIVVAPRGARKLRRAAAQYRHRPRSLRDVARRRDSTIVRRAAGRSVGRSTVRRREAHACFRSGRLEALRLLVRRCPARRRPSTDQLKVSGLATHISYRPIAAAVGRAPTKTGPGPVRRSRRHCPVRVSVGVHAACSRPGALYRRLLRSAVHLRLCRCWR